MNEILSFSQLAGIFRDFGPYGLLVVVWYFDQRKINAILADHAKAMDEMRKFYDSNVKLVEGYERIAKQVTGLAVDFKDLILINTQAVTTLTEDIRQNQYCPLQRLEKRKIEVARCPNG